MPWTLIPRKWGRHFRGPSPALLLSPLSLEMKRLQSQGSRAPKGRAGFQTTLQAAGAPACAGRWHRVWKEQRKI